MASEFEGKAVYEVETAPRFVFAEGKAVIEFAGGDGPFFVQLPEDAALQLIYHGLLTGGKSVGAKLDGITMGRDFLTQNAVMSLSFEGGGAMNVMLDARQEAQIMNPPKLPPRGKPLRQ
ncbi:hypothetical protein [Brevundimonas diminuta]